MLGDLKDLTGLAIICLTLAFMTTQLRSCQEAETAKYAEQNRIYSERIDKKAAEKIEKN